MYIYNLGRVGVERFLLFNSFPPFNFVLSGLYEFSLVNQIDNTRSRNRQGKPVRAWSFYQLLPKIVVVHL
jgi:hypothetical protein